jgi:hypothetical protein
MVIVYWSINPSYIKYNMICTLALCKETNCGKFISVCVYQHLYRDMYVLQHLDSFESLIKTDSQETSQPLTNLPTT